MTATETPMLKDNVKHVHDEMMGKIDHERIGTRPAPLDLTRQPPGHRRSYFPPQHDRG